MRCPRCDAWCPVYDHSPERAWRHLGTRDVPTYVHTCLPQVQCKARGVISIASDWAEPTPLRLPSERIFTLKGWSGPHGHRRPAVIGHYTNDIVYERLAPGVLDELRRLNPTLLSGRRKHLHHQWFTPDRGHPKLKEHLIGVMALMRAAPNWGSFKRSLNRAFPRPGEQVEAYIDD